MSQVVLKKAQYSTLVPEQIPEEITPEDEELFFKVTSVELSPEQIEQVVTVPKRYVRQKVVLATHWHPEFVPIELAMQRVDAMFPNKKEELIIPTQHNELLSHKGYSGVEVDCYSSGFNQKVQLLLHFEQEKVREAGVLKSMLAHTHKYRSSQLFDFMHSFTAPVQSRLDEAAADTGAEADLVRFVCIYVCKIEAMLEKYFEKVPVNMVKNKLLRNFFDALRPQYGDALIDRVKIFLQAVKAQVKANFSLRYFYRASEIIEEARSFGAGVVIPHPEEFWPILLAGYDVDGYEVWNPQSQRYTDFLISVVDNHNRSLGPSKRQILIFMGDDTHMGEKVRPPEIQDPEKAGREIGYQPAWDDLSIRKKLIINDIDRSQVIKEYKARLAG